MRIILKITTAYRDVLTGNTASYNESAEDM